MAERRTHKGERKCQLGEAMDVLAGRWKGEILWFLQDGPQRFMELRRAIPAVSPKVLTQKLRDLELHGLIDRKQYAEIPPRVEYSMTRLGRSAIPVLETIDGWWKKHAAAVRKATGC